MLPSSSFPVASDFYLAIHGFHEGQILIIFYLYQNLFQIPDIQLYLKEHRELGWKEE